MSGSGLSSTSAMRTWYVPALEKLMLPKFTWPSASFVTTLSAGSAKPSCSVASAGVTSMPNENSPACRPGVRLPSSIFSSCGTATLTVWLCVVFVRYAGLFAPTRTVAWLSMPAPEETASSLTRTVNETLPMLPAAAFAIVQLSPPSAFVPSEPSPKRTNSVPSGTASVTVTSAAEDVALRHVTV